MAKKFFSLISGDDIHLAPETKVIPAKQIASLLDAKGLLKKVEEDAEAYRQKVAQECESLREEARKEGFKSGNDAWVQQLENLEKEIAGIKSVIEGNGGLFIGEEGTPKIMKLSYEMIKVTHNKKNKFDTSYFGWMKFEAGAESILKIEEGIKKLDNILRFILIKTVRESKIITAKRTMVMRPRKERSQLNLPLRFKGYGRRLKKISINI